MAVSAMMIKPFPISAKILQIGGEINPVVLMIEATKKPKINHGNIFEI